MLLLIIQCTELQHRIFNRWLALARHARSRRHLLLESENEIRLQTLEKFWDVWRERRLKDAVSKLALKTLSEFLSWITGGRVFVALERWRCSKPFQALVC